MSLSIALEENDSLHNAADLEKTILPDREVLDTFIDALFMHAEEGHLSFRVFAHQDKPPLKCDVSAPVSDLDAVKKRAFEVASWAATHSEPGVFCPPIASFKKPEIGMVKARRKDLVEGYAVSLECDEHCARALKTVRALLGQPTLVVASGGVWQGEPKLHIHYRLSEPARSEGEHTRLRELRSMLCDLVGADGTNKAIVHPIRWAGSVHRKGRPKLARIIEHNPDAEIHLEFVANELEGLGLYKKTSSNRDPSAGFSQFTEDIDLVRRCASLMRNNDLPWDEWNRIIMAFYGATGGNNDGLEEARVWSKKSSKHDDGTLDRRWEHYRTSPPEYLGIGSLIFESRKVDQQFLRKRETVFAKAEAKRSIKRDPTDRDDLPEIKLRAGWLDEEIRKTEAALRDAGRVYQRNRQLVRVARVAKTSAAEDAVRRRKGAMTIIPCEAPWLRLALCQAIRFMSWSKTEEDWVQINPPAEICHGLLSNVGHWESLEVLTSISETPLIDNDGRIIDVPGHDVESGVFFDPGSITFPSIKDHPTRDDAVEAFKVIEHIIAGFPFVDDASKSVAIAAILLPFRRAFLRSSPMTAITAPKMGSGKSLIATVVGYITTGREPVLVSQTKDPDEEKKRLLGVLMQGDPVVTLDNIERPIESDAFATIMTEPSWTERILGGNQTLTVPTTVTWLATGNNLTVAGDMSTRTLVCAIDPQVARPEERDFELNLHEYVPEHRGEIVAACLTILRAYELARGRGEGVTGLTTFGRFEGWSRAIREPLIWLGLADPCDTRKKIEMRDPVRDSLGALLDAWFDFLGGTDGYTVPQAIRAVENAPEIGDRRDQANALRDAMLDISDSDKINPRKVGKFIARHERRIEGYLSFEQDSDFRRAKKWRVADHRSIRLAVSNDDDELPQSNDKPNSTERKKLLF